MRRLVRVGWLLALLAAWAPALAVGAVPAGFSESPVATGLDKPTGIAFLPDGGMLVTEKGGTLLLVRSGSVVTLTTLSVCTEKTMGLLDVAVDPGFSSNGFVYLYRTKPVGSEGPICPTVAGRVNEVVRLRLAGDQVVGGPTAILTGVRTDTGHHNGATLRIGNDGKLYVSTGDAGVGDSQPDGFTAPGESTNPFSQDLRELPGKVLRIGLDGTIPPDNPFVHTPGTRPEIFAYGFRNPFRFGIDPVTGRLWLGDVGQNSWEELDIVRPGGNYGWPRCEGTAPSGCDPPGHVSPIFVYQQDIAGSLGASITGGAFAPCNFGSYGGQYFFGDYVSDRLFHVAPNDAREGLAGSPQDFADGAGGPVDIVFGPDGALYYVAIKVGAVRRVTAQPAPCVIGGGAVATNTQPRTSSDSFPPRLRLRFRKKQPVGRLRISVRPNERATLLASATVAARNAARTYRYGPVRRTLAAGRRRTIALRPRPRALSALRRAAAGGRLVARVRLAATDTAGNVGRARARIRLFRAR
jgi:glucose/arabinose dehydrogenase